MSDKARIGVIGAGWWAVVNHIPVLQQNPDCEVVAVNRLGADELAVVQSQFGIAQGFEDYREMLETVEMDGVVISSPHILHFEHASAALAKGCHILVEKPLTTSAADARALIDAAKAAKARDRRALWLELQADGSRGGAAGGPGVGRVEHVVLQMANALDDLFAGQPMLETEGRDVPPAALDLGRSENGPAASAGGNSSTRSGSCFASSTWSRRKSSR